MAKKKTSGEPKKLAITQVRSTSGRPEGHRRTLAALGLKKRQQTVVHSDSPAIRGMIDKIPHLLQVEEIEE